MKIEEKIGLLLKESNLTLSLAESCTGGLVANRLTNVPGSSEYFYGGIVAYSNSAKIKHLGVNESTLEMFGAVSPETAKEMAEGLRRSSGTDIVLSVTGIAGPSGGGALKPVGLVYIAISGKDKTVCHNYIFKGGREGIKNLTAEKALRLLRDYIAEK